MKVQASIRAIYEQQSPIAEALRARVDGTLQTSKPRRWHFESRIKELKSFALKIETGRVKNPDALEDFLACTIVVPNSASIDEAVRWIGEHFEIKYRRPPDASKTSKSADSFPFDDLRLYCVRGNDGTRPPEPIDNVVFEVQVKTFLQHAWGIATHDLSYKTEDVRWGKDRIASHLKAAVEFAELSIQQAETLSHSPGLQLEHKPTVATADIISLCRTMWRHDELPENLRGLAETVRTILWDAGLTVNHLRTALETAKASSGGLPANLSPYGVILQSLLRSNETQIDAMLRSRLKRAQILLTPEVELPSTFDASV
jgi:ppGpp synthetase/RelA/SpoT-type nucleotidyltranferase